MGLLSSIGSVLTKVATRLTKGYGDPVTDRVVSGLNPISSIIKIGSLGSVAAKVGPAVTKAIVGVAKRPAAVIAGAAIAGVASPGLGRKALGVGTATAIGGPVAGGIVTGLIGIDYAKQTYTQATKSIKTQTPSLLDMGIRADSLTNPAAYNVSETELTLAKQLSAELVSRTGAPGEYEWEVAGKRIGLHELLGTVEASATPTSGVAPEVSAGLNGLLPSNIGSVLLPALAGTAAIGGAYALSRRKKKKKKSKSAKRITKRRKHRRTSLRGFGTSKQYRKAGGKTVHYTKHGQPYIKLKSGKARFIKK